MTHAPAGRGGPASILARSATASSDRSPVARWRPFAMTRRQPRRIGLFGLFGTGNSGNDGSLEAMLRFVRQVHPDAEITCICSAHRGAADRVARSLHVATTPLGIPPLEDGLLRAVDRVLLTLPRRMAAPTPSNARAS